MTRFNRSELSFPRYFSSTNLTVSGSGVEAVSRPEQHRREVSMQEQILRSLRVSFGFSCAVGQQDDGYVRVLSQHRDDDFAVREYRGWRFGLEELV